MARLSLVALAATVAALLALASALPEAIGVLTKTRHCTGSCTGKVTFKAGTEPDSTDVTVTLSGFPANTKLGVHVHDFGDLASTDATAAGGHFNPFGKNHSCSGEDRHVGDLGNVDTDASGNVVFTFTNLTMMLNMDDKSFILGRMVVVHERADDCTSQPSGNAGNRLAAGVIGYLNGTEDLSVSNPDEVEGLTHGIAIIRGVGSSTVNAEVTVDVFSSSNVYLNIIAVGLKPQESYGLYLMKYGDLESVDEAAFYDPSATGNCYSMAGRIGDITADENGFVIDSFLSAFSLDRDDDTMLGRAIAIVNGTDCFEELFAIGVVGVRGSAAWPKATATSLMRGVPSSNLPEDAVVEVSASRVFIGQRSSALFLVEVYSQDFPRSLNASIHVREFGDLTNVDGTSFGGIFNPGSVAHGCHGAGEAGGLGNINIDNQTSYQAWYFFSPLASLDSNEAGSIFGRGIVISSNVDSCAPGFTPGTPVLTGVLGYDYEALSSYGVAAPPNADATKVQATCILMPTAGNTARGSVQLVPQGAGVDVYVTLNNLVPNSLHGFHVHEFGDDSSASGTDMGGHFNPLGYNHSCAPSQLRHAGDLGNVQADKNGRVYAKIHTNLLTLSASGTSSALGRGMILHEKPDDCTTQPTGNAGSRLAQCVIGLSTVRSIVAPTGEPTPTPTSDDGAAGSVSASLSALLVVAAGFLAARA